MPRRSRHYSGKCGAGDSGCQQQASQCTQENATGIAGTVTYAVAALAVYAFSSDTQVRSTDTDRIIGCSGQTSALDAG